MSTMQTAPPGPVPVGVAFDGPERQRRWTVLVRFVLAIPQLVVLLALGMAAVVVIVIGWFAALVTGALPAFAYDFLCGVLDYQMRVDAYLLLLTDRYPPFSLGPADYPVRLAVPARGRLNRLSVLFRIVLAVPAAIVNEVLGFGTSTIVLLVTWVWVLVTGRMPDALYGTYAAVLRLTVRYSAWLGMLTSTYPVQGVLGDPEVLEAPWSAPAWSATPAAGPAPADPVPDVFTYGGPTYLWGYTADRQVCGIWRRDQPGRPPEWWPIDRQSEAWARFRQLEPAAVELHGPDPRDLGFAVPAVAGGTWPGGGGGPVAAGPVPATALADHPGAAAAVPAAVVPAAGARWPSVPGAPLVLPGASKALLVVCMVLGAVTLVANQTVLGALASSNRFGGVRNRPALSTVQQDYRALQAATTAYGSTITACRTAGDGLPCETAADATEAQAFRTFAGQLDMLPVLGSSATAARARVRSDTDTAAAAFTTLAGATSIEQYDQEVAGSGLQSLLTRFDTDVDALQRALGGT